MTPKISLVVIPILASLTLVPAAWGNHQYGDAFYSAEPVAVRVTPDAVDRALTAKLAMQSTPIVSPDAFERAVAATADSDSRIVLDDRINEPMNIPVASSPTSSGSELAWRQIGIGFGVGVVLTIGLFLATRYTRVRPTAH